MWLRNTSILSIKPQYMDHIFREVIEVELYPSNMNREDGFHFSRSWKPLISSLKNHTKPLSQDTLIGFSTGPCRSMHTNLNRASKLHNLDTNKPQAFPSFPSLHPMALLSSTTTCLQPIHNFSPTFPASPPTTYTYEFSCVPTAAQLALEKAKHRHSSPFSYSFSLVIC